ncbi:SRPBCC family protein [Actinomycetospora lutea]|uniref:SRPBCC family protein n=1 Tax=Actinomycetospora lutea TaxID=663604 RepID=UPI0023673D71|nr:SRPBCC family protein [Actinomycetospora lutea]MDD7938656.1 SRPBCC family protein [Actinomycetospora lutea]
MTERQVSRSIDIDAPPHAVFELLADPRRHPDFDGSGTVRSSISGPSRLSLGSTFGVGMRIKLPYRISNTVVEFEEDKRIAWRHFNRHRWRYELEATASGTTVTETFDWSTALVPALLDRSGFPAANARGIEKTLPRLKALAEGR